MTAIPSNPDAPLTRKQTAAALAEAGYPVTATSLSGLAHQGEGPPYVIFGKYALIRWRDALAWAEARLRDPSARASEHEARRAELKALRAERKAAWVAERAAIAESHPTAAE